MAAQTQPITSHVLVAELSRAARLEKLSIRVHRCTLPEEVAGQDGPARLPGHRWSGASSSRATRRHDAVVGDDGGASSQGAPQAAASNATPTGPTGDPVAALGAVADLLHGLTTVAWHEIPGQAAHDALDHLELAARRLAAVRAQVLTAVDGNGLWALHGSRTFAAWLRHRTGTTAGTASRLVRESRALRDHLPLTRAALAQGRIGADHAAVLVRETVRTAELRAQLAHPEVGEAFLVEQAAMMDAGTFTKLVQAWAIAADPAGADRAWREADAKEELTLSPTIGGWQLRGWLDELSGHVVSTALKAHSERKGPDDQRTPAQRRAAALVALAHQSLDAGRQGTGARIRPHVTVTTSLELLRALAAATGSAIPPTRPDGTGAAFGLPAPHAPSASGEPRESDNHDTAGSAGGTGPGAGPFRASAEARRWVEHWRPGDAHVISTAIDHHLLTGLQPATLADGTPLPPGLLARLVCESQLSRVVFGPESTILDAGREKRIFPANQVRAIIARDKHCRYPQCDEPPYFGEIHHSLWWAQHLGGTDAEHGLLLCWHHHDWVHAHDITITRSAGQWWFHDRNGRLMTAGTDPP